MNFTEPSQETLAAAKSGMDAAARTNGDAWNEYAEQFIRDYIREHRTMHVDDLWRAGLKKPKNQRGLGKIISTLRKANLIRKIPVPNVPGAYAARGSKGSNGTCKPVWWSTAYGSIVGAPAAPEWGGSPKTES
jgi:hypothetical protein